MTEGCNDYISLTRRYLKNYNKFKITLVNLNEEIKALEKELGLDVTAPISKYGDSPGGGYPELNVIESAVERRMKKQSELENSRNSYNEVKRVVTKIDRALKGLSEVDRTVITAYYFEGISWSSIGRRYKNTERWAREKGGQALKEISFMVFGNRVNKTIFAFVE